MKKTIVISLIAVLILAVAVPVAMAALNDSQKEELDGLYRQQYELQQRILEKKAEFGLVDEEDAQAIRERMEQRWEVRKERMAEGDYSFGRGGKMGRKGGFARMGGGGCGNCPVESGGPEL